MFGMLLTDFHHITVTLIRHLHPTLSLICFRIQFSIFLFEFRELSASLLFSVFFPTEYYKGKMDFAVPTCPKNRPCKLVCCSVNCTRAPYVCRIEGCPCDAAHQHCKHVNWDTLLHELIAKIPSKVDPILAAVRKFLTEAIADLQAELDGFETFIENTIGLTENEQDFLRILKTKRHEQLSGSAIYQLQKDLSVPPVGLPVRSKEDLELDLTLWKKQLKTLLHTIRISYDNGVLPTKSLKDERSTASSRIDRSPLRSLANEPTFNPFQSPSKQTQSAITSPKQQDSRIKAPQPSRFKQENQPVPFFNLASKITNDTKTLMDFFYPKPVKTFKLLYRASEHRFSVAQFHRLCDLIPNTLTILKTEFGEIIGGFTPLQWSQARDGHYQSDPSGSSFLFHLSRKQKMKLTESSCATANDSRFGPVFGSGHDLAIADMADRYAHSSCEFPSSYNNGYGKNQDSVTRFSGAKNGVHFKIVEWEVYQVLFDR